MKTVSVILARGGSKGIPRKNLIELCYRPLITYAIEASILSQVQETWVSTDNQDIATVARKWGAHILERPSNLAEDTSSSEAALMHFASHIQFDNLVFIQPTSPLLKHRHIDEALRTFSEKKYDSMFSGFYEHWLPRWTASSDKIYPRNFQLNKRPRRQDAELIAVENGAFYISTRRALIDSGCRYSGDIGFYEMLPSESFQVDSWDDLRIIEALMGRFK